MSQVTIVDLKRYGWSQKIVKSSFVIEGKPPYVQTLNPKKVSKQVLPKKKCRKCYVGQDLFVTNHEEHVFT